MLSGSRWLLLKILEFIQKDSWVKPCHLGIWANQQFEIRVMWLSLTSNIFYTRFEFHKHRKSFFFWISRQDKIFSFTFYTTSKHTFTIETTFWRLECFKFIRFLWGLKWKVRQIPKGYVCFLNIYKINFKSKLWDPFLLKLCQIFEVRCATSVPLTQNQKGWQWQEHLSRPIEFVRKNSPRVIKFLHGVWMHTY